MHDAHVLLAARSLCHRVASQNWHPRYGMMRTYSSCAGHCTKTHFKFIDSKIREHDQRHTAHTRGYPAGKRRGNERIPNFRTRLAGDPVNSITISIWRGLKSHLVG